MRACTATPHGSAERDDAPTRQHTGASAGRRVGGPHESVGLLAFARHEAAEVLLHEDREASALGERLLGLDADLLGSREALHERGGEDDAHGVLDVSRKHLRRRGITEQLVAQRRTATRTELDHLRDDVSRDQLRELVGCHAQTQRASAESKLHRVLNVARATAAATRPDCAPRAGGRMLHCVPGRRAAIILAGGGSRRMGRPKASLQLGDETLLGRVVRIAAAACDDVIVVGAAGLVLPEIEMTTTFRTDDAPEHTGRGPLAGAFAGLVAAGERGAEVAYLGAVDAAWLTTRHVDAMLETVQRDAACTGAVPYDDGVWHATSGALRVDVATDASRRLLTAGEGALWRLFDEVGATRVSVAALPDASALRGCNTPADYADAVRELEGQRSAERRR